MKVFSVNRSLAIGMIGYGFMSRAHTNAYKRVNDFFPELTYRPVLQAVCGRNESHVNEFATQWNYASFETDWRKLVERDDIDAVDICVPNNLHCEIAIAAAAAGKMVFCEKPLAMNAAEGEAMCQAVETANVANMVWYNYRRIPAVALAKVIVDEGRLGQIYHFRANFLQDWTMSSEIPQGGAATWRLDSASSGSGVTGDLLAHCIDTAMWLNGQINDVSAMTKTFITERMHAETRQLQQVRIDDACAFMCHFENGSLGFFESTRYARGHKALFTFEINGEHGSIRWDLHDLNRLEYFDHGDDSKVRGWRSIHVTESDMPYMNNWWVPGLCIGYEHSFIHQVSDFLGGLEKGQVEQPSFRSALRTQCVCDSILQSASSREWVPVE